MFFENLNTLIAKSADFTNKPFLHSVVNINSPYELDNEDIDITVNILCRDIEGNRINAYDLELEIFRSNNDLVFVLSKLNSPDDPILWSGTKNLWMDSKSGKKCNPPAYSFRLENLANKIKMSLEVF